MANTNPFTTTLGSTTTVISGYLNVPSNWSAASSTFISGTTTLGATQWTTPFEIPEDVARKLVDLIKQLDRLDDSEELNAVAAGIAQEAECSEKAAKTTLTALRSLLNLAAIERKLEAV